MTTATLTRPAHTDAWNILGEQDFTETTSVMDAMKQGNLLDWNVRLEPAFTTVDGKKIPMTGRAAAIRTNPLTGQPEYLGDVGSGYKIVQNEDHGQMLETLLDETGAVIENVLHRGAQVFIVMKLPGHINIGGVDPIDLRVAAINSHDGSMSYTLMTTPVRWFCANVLNSAIKNSSNLVRVRHTSGAEAALHREARTALDRVFAYSDAFKAHGERLIQTPMNQSQFEQIIEREFGAPEDASKAAITRSEKKIDLLAELFADTYTQDNIRGTAWAGYNALTEFADHYSPTRGEEHEREGNRAMKAILDPSFKTDALNLMLDFASRN